MTKQQTQMIKGVAILLMIFLHLFYRSTDTGEWTSYLYINGIPFVIWLSKATNPVGFFLILGGYGMYKVCEKGDKHRWSRVGRLYINFWISLLLLVTIGWAMHNPSYPGNWHKILINFTSVETTYNAEMWFLLPYAILSLLSPCLFKLYAHFPGWLIIGVTLFIHLSTSFCISRYAESFLYQHYYLYDILLVFHLLFNFSLGAVAARSHFFEKIQQYAQCRKYRSLFFIGCIIFLVVICCTVKYGHFKFYEFLIITCILNIPIPQFIRTCLGKLGNLSMNMWMVHSWFVFYLFPEFVYSFKFPILIFLIATLLSYFTASIVAKLSTPIERFIFNHKAIEKTIS